jgi:hypothetical protein
MHPDMPADSAEESDGQPPRPSTKRPYVKPAVIAYGTLARLTRNGKGSGTDGGAVMAMRCL